MRPRAHREPAGGFGCDVVGVDRGAAFLEVARRAGQPVDYHLAFSSFGYFDERATGRCWRPGGALSQPIGRLIIDHQNRQRRLGVIAANAFHEAIALVERSDDLLIDRTTFEVATARTHTERISVRDGRVRRYRFNVRTFAFTELRDWLLQAGFARVEGCGPRGEPLALDSARMIVLASV